jgi:hypothetical protein
MPVMMALLAPVVYFISLLFLPPSAKAQTAGRSDFCAQQARPIETDVRVFSVPTRFDYSKSPEELAAMTNTPRGYHTVNHGVTSARLNTKIDFRMQVAALGRTLCVIPVSLTVEVGYDEMTVYVSRRHQQGSCPFRVTLDHEMEHVQTNMAALNRHVPAIRSALQRVASQMKPIATTSQAEAERRILDEAQRGIASALEAMKRDRDNANARMDTPSEYARLHAKCPKW